MAKSIYTIKVKCKNRKGEPKFITYHKVTNLLRLVQYFDNEFSDWYYFNVFNLRGEQIANFTKNNKPRFAQL